MATVTSATSDDVPSNNTASATTAITTSADVALTKAVTPAPWTAGSTVTYTLTATNNGPSTAAGVTLADPLPLGLTYVGSTPAGTCTSANSNVTCALGALNPNQSSTVTITASIASHATGTITNTAVVKSTTSDPVSTNNSASVPVTVTSSADLAITKSASTGTVTAGNPVGYTIAVKNSGPSDAQAVMINDPAVAGLSIESAANSQGTCTVAANAVAAPSAPSAPARRSPSACRPRSTRPRPRQ